MYTHWKIDATCSAMLHEGVWMEYIGRWLAAELLSTEEDS